MAGCNDEFEVVRHCTMKETGTIDPPSVQTSYRREVYFEPGLINSMSADLIFQISLTSDVLNNVQDLITCLERKKFSLQRAPVSEISLMQKQLSAYRSKVHGKGGSADLNGLYKRILDREINWPNTKKLLDGLLQLAIFTKVQNKLHFHENVSDRAQHLQSCTLEFLLAFVPIWDGHEGIDEILSLLSFFPPMNFKRKSK